MSEIYRSEPLGIHRQIYFIVALLVLIVFLFAVTAGSFGQENIPAVRSRS